MARKPKPSGAKKRKRSMDSYTRSYGKRRMGKSILIVCEGEKTEPIYFNHLRRKLNLTTVMPICSFISSYRYSYRESKTHSNQSYRQ